MNELKLPLTNIQLELLKLYSTGMSDEYLLELKDVFANYFAQKAIQLANEVWDERKLTNRDMDKWLTEKS